MRSRRRAAGRSCLPLDVSDAEAVEAAASAAEEAFGPIDVWVNDAMVTVYAEFLDIEPDEFRRATDVTYHGMVWGTRSALKRMLPRDRGTIVQVCSAMSYRGIPLQSPYCGAKAACKNFTESILTELVHKESKVQRPDGDASRREHDPVHLGSHEAAEADDARSADLPARGRRGGDPLDRLQQSPSDLRRHSDRPERPRRARRAVAARHLPRQDRLSAPSRPTSRSTRAGTTTSSSRSTRTAERTDRSTISRTITRRRHGSPATAGPSAGRSQEQQRSSGRRHYNDVRPLARGALAGAAGATGWALVGAAPAKARSQRRTPTCGSPDAY